MDFVKKNWGLLACTLIFVVILTIITVKIVGNRSEFAASEKKLKDDKAWFERVRKDGWEVQPNENGQYENVSIANDNRDIADSHYTDLKKILFNRFSFKPALPQNSVQAQEMLDRKLAELVDYAIVQNKITWRPGILGGRFRELATQDMPIKRDDFPVIFRQLLIYDKLIRLIVASKIKTVDILEFPNWLTIEDGEEYTTTPVIISVEADSKTIQDFVNNLVRDPNMLAFIRSMEFEAPSASAPLEEYWPVVLERQAALMAEKSAILGAGASGTGFGGAAPVEDGNSGSRRRASRRRNAETAASSMSSFSGISSDMLTRQIDESFLVPVEPQRQNFLVFKTPRTIRLNLNLDIIEFKPAEEPEASEV